MSNKLLNDDMGIRDELNFVKELFVMLKQISLFKQWIGIVIFKFKIFNII